MSRPRIFVLLLGLSTAGAAAPLASPDAALAGPEDQEATTKEAQPDSMAPRREERTWLPPRAERMAMHERLARMRAAGPARTLAVYPSRNQGALDPAGSDGLLKPLLEAGLAKAVPAGPGLLLAGSEENADEGKALWDFARAFREHLRQNPPPADYALAADFVFTPGDWSQGYVHFVVCDRAGDWVIVGSQNRRQPDYQALKPDSAEACRALVVRRLEARLEAPPSRRQEAASGWQGGHNRFMWALSEDDVLMPITSIEWGRPDRWSLTCRYVHMFTRDREQAAMIHSLTATLSPGTSGGRVGLGYHGVWKAGPVPLLPEARLVLLRTWGNPLGTGPGRTFLGAEIRLSVVGVVNAGIGYYWPFATVDGSRESLWEFHVGVGL